MNILLVEPDRVLGESTKQILTTEGHIVIWSRSAQAALDSLDEHIPELIILEIQLGIHNGIEFLYEIRSYTEWQNLPVVVLSMNANVLDSHFSEPFEQLGVNAVLYKPRTSTKQLTSLINQFATMV